MVVRLDGAMQTPSRPIAVGHNLSVRAASYDRRRLNSHDVETARVLIDRGAHLSEGAQVDLANRVADRLDSQLGGVRQSGDEATAFIAAVLAPPETELSPDPDPEPVGSALLEAFDDDAIDDDAVDSDADGPEDTAPGGFVAPS
jgi:hypothetical protein